MIDLYCERTVPGLWGEPFNLLSSAAYLVAAWLLIRSLRGRARVTLVDRAFAWLPAIIAIGSALFHAFASPWARRLDEAPILVFQLLFLWTYGRRMIGMSSVAVAFVLVAFVAAVAAGRAERELLNGSLPYMPALFVAAAIGSWHAGFAARDRFVPLAGACAFAVAVVFRVIDHAACGQLPIGTHFMWHVLTAVVVYAFGKSIVGQAFRPDGPWQG